MSDTILETNEEIFAKYVYYVKLWHRILRNGNTETNTRGRSKLSDTHKKRVRKLWIEKQKVKKRAQAEAEGRKYERGRPVLIIGK